MNARRQSQWNGQRGFSLSEILVAVAIFTIIMVAALALYDRSNRVFKQANESAEMQQNTRVAFEKIVSEVRMAGFDFNRTGTPSVGIPTPWVENRAYNVGALVTPKTANGHVYVAIDDGTSSGSDPAWSTTSGAEIPDGGVIWKETGVPVYEQPDEQIEYAGAAAITIRGNFDFDINANATGNGRETALETASDGHFPVVTTGNDEIVTYALRSVNGPNANISFYADVNDANTPADRRSYPGGSVERLITIPNVNTTNANPPYTLYRFTITNDGRIQETALADNIRSLEFQYWEDAAARTPLTDLEGDDPAPNIGGGGQYDPNDNDLIPERTIRGKIRAVTVTLTGMSAQPDADYTHPNDDVAPKYRQYELSSTIVGRNLGLKGQPQADTNAPDPPTLDSVCFGYCGIAVVSWTPAKGTIDTSYSVLIDDDADGSYIKAFSAGTQTKFAVDMTQMDKDSTWYFRVSATNAGGTTLSTGDPIGVSIQNVTKPNMPTALNATEADAAASPSPNKITLTWKAASGNAAGLAACSPGSVSPTYASIDNEIRGFRIYRSTTDGFEIDDADAKIVYDVTTTGATNDGAGNWTWVDTTVANCTPYYYRIQTVEWCDEADENTGNNADLGVSEPSAQDMGMAASAVKPNAPTGLAYNPANECNAITNTCNPVTLTWNPVLTDVGGAAITVNQYRVYRRQKKNSTYTQSQQLVALVTDATTYTDNTGLREHDTDDVQFYYDYAVSAVFGAGAGSCELEGAQSALITYPGPCSTLADVDVEALGGTGYSNDPYTDVTGVTITEDPSKPLVSVKYQVDGGTWSTLTAPYAIPWDETTDSATHPVRIELKTASCTEYRLMYIKNDAPACTPEAVIMNHPTDTKKVNVVINNTLDEVLTLSSVAFTWLGDSVGSWAWTTVTYPAGGTASATPTSPATTATARTMAFTPPSGDRTVPANGTYTITLTLTGTGYAKPSKFTVVNLDYTRPSTGSLPFDCDASPLTPCRVSSVTTLNSSVSTQLLLTITNTSTEDLNLSSISIYWDRQNKWGWNSITMPPSTTINLPAQRITAGTEVISLTGHSIPAGSTNYQIKLNFTAVGPGTAQALDPTLIDAVTLFYTTTSSNGLTMRCHMQQ